MSTKFKTLNEYFYPENRKKTFLIPNYQRGYKWSVKSGEEPTQVEDLIARLITSYKENPNMDYFLQGVTVAEDGNTVILIDGQQRTTTLYLLLWCLGRENITDYRDICLEYSVRPDSGQFLKNLKKADSDYTKTDPENKIQDIYYFKQAINQINKALPGVKEDREEFLKYVLYKIKLLYIVIDKSKAVNTFTMMNGHKATMHDEELIKASILHQISLPEEIQQDFPVVSIEDNYFLLKEIVSLDWETNALRSKYAREWDKWLYWWNRDDVKNFFSISSKPMGLLLEYYFKQCNCKGDFTFRNFSQLLPAGSKKSAKDVFKGLRDLQKGFEDLFNAPIIYNELKLALIGSSDKYTVIMYFMEHKHDLAELERYAKFRLAGVTHNEYLAEDGTEGNLNLKEKVKSMRNHLAAAKVYNVYNDDAFKQLLRFNVVEYNRLNAGKGVKFDFSIWDGQKSLEHIFPKSHFYHVDRTVEPSGEVTVRYIRGDGEEIAEIKNLKDLYNSQEVFSRNTSRYSEHCIGNLVLLYGRDNSGFGAKDFLQKKHRFFDTKTEFESRNLLHTISYFANETWSFEDIMNKADELISRIEKDYNIQSENNHE